MSYKRKQWNEVLSIVSGKNQKAVVNPEGQYPIYGSGGIMGYADDYLCEAGTTIVGRKGTINNPIFVAERFWNVDTAFGITPGEELNPKYLYYFCRHFNFKALDKSTTIPSLAKRDLLAVEMPVPSLDEQKRIVARIEELFSELDNGVEILRKSKQQLAVYRQAVLKDAFSEVSLNEYLPLRTVIVGSPQNGLYKPKSAYGSGTRILRIDGFYDGKIADDYDFKRLGLSESEIEQYRLNEYDLVVNRVNSMPYLGKCALVRNLAEVTVYESNMMRMQLDTEKVDPEYVTHYLSSFVGRKELTKNAKQAVNQASINQTDVGNALIPIPASLAYQRKVVASINARMSVCDSIEKTVDTTLQQAEAMRQSILKKAFEGNHITK